MKISAINSISFRKTNTQKKSLELNSQNINKTQQNNCNLFYKPAFGKRIYEDFNVEKLPNIGLEQEFSRTELVPSTGSVDLTSLLGLTSSLAESGTVLSSSNRLEKPTIAFRGVLIS